VNGPVLLLGGGPGLATSGLLYLGSYLRRHGVEAYARPFDGAQSLVELERRLHHLLDRFRPSVVGISLKWFLHIHRALHAARVIKAHDPAIKVVLGGDTASHYYRELLEFDCVDWVIRGDGEAALLGIARGKEHPNAWRRGKSEQKLVGLGDLYLQRRDADDSLLADLDAIFLCESDGYWLPPFVVGGKGCSQGCLYCGGARGAQAENFGRRKSFMRPLDNVRNDIVELMSRAYCLVYDFSDHPLADPTQELRRLWSGLDLSQAGILYYAWRVPPPGFVELLASSHQAVTLGLDFGCFSERQRRALIRAHLLKPLPDDAEFLSIIEECRRYPNVRVRVSAVAGLPLSEPGDLDAERRLVEKLVGWDHVEDVLFDRVHAQPGAPLLADPERFGMASPVRSFADFLAWSERHAPNGEYEPPLLRHAASPEADLAIDRAHRELHELVNTALAARAPDAARFSEFNDVAERRFVRTPRSRVLNRYWPRRWWLDFERPEMPDAALDEEQARIAFGHVWQEEFGAISVPAKVADYVLPVFDQPRRGAEALAEIRARGAAIDPAALTSIIRFFYERGIVEEA